MAARAALFSLVSTDPVLLDLGFVKTYAQNAVDTPPERRFAIIRWDTTEERAFGQKAPDRASVHFHDKDQDYGQIDLALQRMKDILRDAVHVQGEDGWVITQADWQGEGPDGADEGYGTVVRSTEIRVISRYDGPN